MHADKGNAYRDFPGKPEGKRPLERPRNRCDDNIKMDPGVVWAGFICLRIGASGRILRTQ
jgi:hypothetical protein